MKKIYDYSTKPFKTETVKAHGYCEDCDFEVHSGNAVGLIAQHAGSTGHTCHVEITQKHQWQKGIDIKHFHLYMEKTSGIKNNEIYRIRRRN